MGSRLYGKTAWVNGAAGTLGSEIALLFAQEGAALILSDLKKGELERAAYNARKNGAEVFSGCFDATEEIQVQDFYHKAVEKFGKVDVLVNACGAFLPEKPAWEITAQEFEHIWKVNTAAPFYACKAVVPGMLRQGYGRIVNITSSLSVVPMPLWGAYSAAKAALNALTRTLAQELKGHDVLVNGVDPGAYRSPQNPTATVSPMKALPDILLCATLPRRSLSGRFIAEGKDLGW